MVFIPALFHDRFKSKLVSAIMVVHRIALLSFKHTYNRCTFTSQTDQTPLRTIVTTNNAHAHNISTSLSTIRSWQKKCHFPSEHVTVPWIRLKRTLEVLITSNFKHNISLLFSPRHGFWRQPSINGAPYINFLTFLNSTRRLNVYCNCIIAFSIVDTCVRTDFRLQLFIIYTTSRYLSHLKDTQSSWSTDKYAVAKRSKASIYQPLSKRVFFVYTQLACTRTL